MSWKSIELADLCEVFADGDWIESKDQSSDGVRLIQTGNIGFGYFKSRDEKSRFISEETFQRLRCTEIKEGDLLVSRLPEPVGRACLLPVLEKKSITAVDCTIIRTKKEILNSAFLNYYCQSPQYFQQVNKNITGATRQRISRSLLGKVSIPLPRLSTQEKIVEKLNVIFDEINKASIVSEANVKNAEALFRTSLIEIFESKKKLWSYVPLGDVCKTSAGGTPLKANKEYYEGGNIPWLLSGEVCNKYIHKAKNFITQSGVNNSSARLFPKKTTLVAMYGATAGQVGILEFPATTNQAVCGILPSDKYLPEFLYYYFQYYKNTLLLEASGVAQPNLSQVKIKAVPLPMIEIDLQQRLVKKLELIDQNRSLLAAFFTQKIISLSYLKKSVLQEAFNNKLVKE